MKLRGRNKVDATFNMSSMTDIVFLLLIFFIVLSTFVSVTGLDIDLPKTAKPPQVPNNSKIVIEIDADLNYAMDAKPTSLDQIISALQTRAIGVDYPSIVLKADKTIPWEKGLEVIAEAKALGYTKIVVASDAKK